MYFNYLLSGDLLSHAYRLASPRRLTAPSHPCGIKMPYSLELKSARFHRFQMGAVRSVEVKGGQGERVWVQVPHLCLGVGGVGVAARGSGRALGSEGGKWASGSCSGQPDSGPEKQIWRWEDYVDVEGPPRHSRCSFASLRASKRAFLAGER